MTQLETQLLEKLRILPVEKQHEVMDFVELLVTNTDNHLANTTPQRSFSDFFGILKDSPNFNEDPVTIQRTLRHEWD